jgi:hypothetical protein
MMCHRIELLVSFVQENSTHRLFAHLLEGDPPAGADAQRAALRAALQSRGVSSRGWRMYLEIGDTLFEPLQPRMRRRRVHEAGRDGVAFLLLIQAGEMDVPPPRELVAALCRIHLPGQGLEALPAYLFRAAWKECARLAYGRDDIAQWLSNEAIPLFDWFLRTDQASQMDENRKRANWSSYVDRWNQWLDQPAEPDGERHWPALLPRMEYGGLVIAELCHEVQLFAEGEAMSHCVAICVGDCLRSEMHVFSISERRSGARLATLALSRTRDGGWEIDQIKGRCNQSVTPMRGVDEAAMALLRCVEDAGRLAK